MAYFYVSAPCPKDMTEIIESVVKGDDINNDLYEA